MARRVVTISLLAVLCAACGGGAAGSAAPTEVAAATAPSTPAPTTAPQRTSPPATQIPGCLPACWTGRLTRPNAISGEYTTKNFFGGQLTVTVPEGWWGYEDSTGELSIGLPNDEFARMEFWIDVYASSDPSGTPDGAIERTGDAVTTWFLTSRSSSWSSVRTRSSVVCRRSHSSTGGTRRRPLRIRAARPR